MREIEFSPESEQDLENIKNELYADFIWGVGIRIMYEKKPRNVFGFFYVF